MSRNNTLIGFDFERGDKLTILRECAIDLSKQKREFVAVVLVSLIIDYFSADSNSPMPEITAEDPLVIKLFGDLKKVDENVRDIIIGQMNGALSRYIEHQRVNARDEFVRRVGNAINGWKKNHPGEDVPKEYLELIGAFERATKTNVTDLVDRANAHAKSANAHQKSATATDKKRTEQDFTEGKEKSCSVPDNKLSTPTGTGGECAANAALSASIEGEVQYSDGETMQKVTAADFRCDYVTPLLKAIGDSNPSATRQALINARTEIGGDRFDAIAWKFLKDFAEAWNKRDETRAEFRKFYSEKFPGAPLEGSDYEKRWATSKRGSAADLSVDCYLQGGNASRTLFGRLKAYRKK